MNVILLTVFVGLVLVGLAMTLFGYVRRVASSSSPERDSLMPLQAERVVVHREGERR